MSSNEQPRTLFHNGYIWHEKAPTPKYGWAVVEDNNIVEIGQGAFNPDKASESTNQIDLNGNHILPGFVDCHTHVTVSAWIPFCLDGSSWRTKKELLNSVAKASESLESDAWIISFYTDFHFIHEIPTAEELDIVSGGRPTLIVDFGLHRSIANTEAMRRANISRIHFPDGYVETKRGKLTGFLKEFANAQALDIALTELSQQFSDLNIATLLSSELDRHLSLGITAAHDPCVHPKLQNLMERLSDAHPIRLSWSHVHSHEDIDLVSEDVCLACGEGPRSAKLFLDGGSECALCLNPAQIMKMSTACMVEAVRGDSRGIKTLMDVKMKYRDGKFKTDYLKQSPSDLSKRLEKIGGEGKRPKIHAIGNEAVACACTALKEIQVSDATLEHLTFVGDEELDLLAEASAVASLQPGFLHSSASITDCFTDKALNIIPAKSLLKRDIDVALSSDNPCGPLNPLSNIQTAINRIAHNGRIVGEQEALSVSEAVEAYSSGGFKAIHGKDSAGLDVGSVADFVILSGSPEHIQTRVISTWIDGRKVWPR